MKQPHPICDLVEAGHVFAEKVKPEERVCLKDKQPWPCADIREARRVNAARAQKRELRPLHNTPDRLTGAMR